MRNINEYPITQEELIAALDTAAQRENDDDRIGDLDGYILGRLYELAQEGHILAEQL